MEIDIARTLDKYLGCIVGAYKQQEMLWALQQNLCQLTKSSTLMAVSSPTSKHLEIIPYHTADKRDR